MLIGRVARSRSQELDLGGDNPNKYQIVYPNRYQIYQEYEQKSGI